MKVKLDRKFEIHVVLPLAALFGFVLFLHITVGLEFLNIIPQELVIPIIEGMEDEFTAFALIVNFAYELIPQTLQQIGVGAISTVLLVRGFNPFAFGFVIALGKLTGQYIIYFVARVAFHHRKKNLGGLASANHFLHKYHYIAFLFPAWISIAGDALMFIAGQQRINPVKILPILFISDLAEAYKWVFWTVGQLEVTDAVDTL